MNTYLAAKTRKSAFKVTRWTQKIIAPNKDAAFEIARKKIRPNIGQALWIQFHSTESIRQKGGQ